MPNHCHPANSQILAPGIPVPGACCLWDDGSTGNPRTVTPLQNAQYSVTVLDEQLRPAIRRYKVEVVSIQTELLAALAPGDFCGAGPVTLRVEGALPHYTYLWSTSETTPSIQIPLSGLAPAYRVTVTDARQDGAGNTVACAQVLELRAAEVLAAVEEQQCNLLYSRLEALGFEARQVKIVEPVQAIAPRSSASATCNVTDNTDFSVEWYDEPLDPSGILCSEMAEMEGVTQGFIFASDGICSEADLAAMEALINDQTLLHVYLKPCAGEEFGVLMERGVQDMTELYNGFYNYDGTYLGTDGENKNKVFAVFSIDPKTAEKGLASKLLIDLKNGIHIGSTNPIVWELQISHTTFKDIAGTLYAEGSSTYNEAAGIYSVMRNRAKKAGKTIQEIASGGGIYGWKSRSKIHSPFADKQQVKNANLAVITGIIWNKDYSGGAYYWHGVDFGLPEWRAYQDYYNVGFLFTDPSHDLWRLGSKKSENKDWDYKYQSTAAEGKTTFMKLTAEWKIAVNYQGKW